MTAVAAPVHGRTLSRGMRLALLLGPGFVLIVLPFVAAMILLGAYSLNLRDTTGSGIGFSVWQSFLSDQFNWQVIWRSVRIAALSTLITVVIAYPVAAALLRVKNRFYLIFAYVALFSPLLVSVISRSYGWLLLLSDSGFVNQMFGMVGLGPYRMVFNETGVMIAIVHVVLPYAVLPILNIMTQIPPIYREAALDLGASGWTVFRKVSLPLTLPGVIVAAEIIFALSISAFVTPSLLGGGRVLTLSRMLYDNIGLIEWGMAAVQAIVLLTTALAVLLVLERTNRSTHAARQ
ncbi:ABC transporter permease [Mesorhizobium sp. YR577]|uniref:ABC transporter permease n=1 Tax=Mesorhizobium sp. YR577 TaxID=1884373 RepID=UPI0008F409A5|nr:ABC transporter permease [Mesorhizobium sp. YR577]SFU15609.1 putative spermidine/putrescine transport system permease protein [Mesorhizobium sp. YR577]